MSRFPRLLALATALVLPCIARAVIVYGGDGTQNTTAPAADSPAYGVPWERVGLVAMTSTFNATGVYLGNYGGKDWVLTAAHVGAHDFTLNGKTYSAVDDSALQLTTLGGAKADLLLFQITTPPDALPLNMPLLRISSAQLELNTSVTMIGNGYNRRSSLVGWDVAGTTWSTVSPVGADAIGYYHASDSSQSLRWGTNKVSEGDVLLKVGARSTICQATRFDAINGDAQGASGDSGGGVFSQDSDGEWMLSGIVDYIGDFRAQGQPTNTAVVGNLTYFADLSAYRGQILTAIPEPQTTALLAGVAGLGLALWSRRRR